MSFFVERNESEKIKFFLYNDIQTNICISRDDKKDLFESVNFIVESLGRDFNVPVLKETEKDQEISIIKVQEKVIKYEEKYTFEVELEVKKPNHSEISYMLSNSTRIDNGVLSTDINVYNDIRIRNLLLNWNLKDEDNEILAVTDENINKLNHRIFQIFVSYINSKIPLYI